MGKLSQSHVYDCEQKLKNKNLARSLMLPYFCYRRKWRRSLLRRRHESERNRSFWSNDCKVTAKPQSQSEQ